MRPLTKFEIIQLQKPIQHFNDSYLLTSIDALARSKNGKKILSKNILHNGDGFKIRFQNINRQKEDFFISKENIEILSSDSYHDVVLYNFQHPNKEKAEFFKRADKSELPALHDEYYNELLEKLKQNEIIKAIEIAMDKVINKYPNKKPLISRIVSTDKHEKFEFNYPSIFLEMFTGKKPIALNERTLRMNLKKNKEEAIELFENIDKANDFSMVAGTGLFPRNGLSTARCYTLEGVNSENKYLQIFDCRNKKSITLTFEQAIQALKYLTGYIT